MSAPQTLSLDHVGLAIDDLEAARAAYARLGFTLTQRSVHAGSTGPGTPVVPWGSGNHCAMFERGYFEIVGLVDREKHSTVKHLIKDYEGLHIVALRCADAAASQKDLVARDIKAAVPQALERDALCGVANDIVRRARFANVYLDTTVHTEARFIVIEHQTPDVLWQPHLLKHENGALGLRGVYFTGPDATALTGRLSRIAGVAAEAGVADGESANGDGAATQDAARIALDGGNLYAMSADAFRRAIPVPDAASAHRVAAAQIQVRSLDALRQLLTSRDVPFYEQAHSVSGDAGATLWVGPAHAYGTYLEFTEAN